MLWGRNRCPSENAQCDPVSKMLTSQWAILTNQLQVKPESSPGLTEIYRFHYCSNFVSCYRKFTPRLNRLSRGMHGGLNVADLRKGLSVRNERFLSEKFEELFPLDLKPLWRIPDWTMFAKNFRAIKNWTQQFSGQLIGIRRRPIEWWRHFRYVTPHIGCIDVLPPIWTN